MSRRPLGPGVQPRAVARMAPGGRMWSESPVRRPYPRVRQMGVAPGLLCEGSVDQYRLTVGTPTLTLPSTHTGQTAVFVAQGYGVGWSAPPGWTVLASGANGSMTYLVAWATLAAGTALVIGTDLAPGWAYGSAGQGLGQVVVRWYQTSGVAPTILAAPTSHTAQLTHAPAAGLAQTNVCEPPSATPWAVTWQPVLTHAAQDFITLATSWPLTGFATVNSWTSSTPTASRFLNMSDNRFGAAPAGAYWRTLLPPSGSNAPFAVDDVVLTIDWVPA